MESGERMKRPALSPAFSAAQSRPPTGKQRGCLSPKLLSSPRLQGSPCQVPGP